MDFRQEIPQKRLKLVFVGAGWVGGITSAIMAEYWPEHNFFCYDISEQVIAKWKSDKMPFYEPGLPEAVLNTRGKNLFFTTDKKEAFSEADFLLICVHTPTKKLGIGQGEVHDLRFVESCANDISNYFSEIEMVKPIAIVEKSTVGPQTCDLIEQIFRDRQKHSKNKELFCVLSSPEFLAEGVAVRDVKEPHRVIIGSKDDPLSKSMVEIFSGLYERFVPKDRIITTKTYTSELSKVASNAFLAQRISSINSLTPICERIGIDVAELSKCIRSDPRIGNQYLTASVGFGGSCLEKDTLSLVYLARSLGLLEVADYWSRVVAINTYQKHRISEMIIKELYLNLFGKKITFLGVAFKKNTCDCRGAPALDIAKALLLEGASIQVYDPQATRDHFVKEYLTSYPEETLEQERLSRVVFHASALGACQDANAIVVLTEWDEFSALDYSKIFEVCKKPIKLFDCRGSLDQTALSKIGFRAFKIGCGSV